MLLKIGKVLGVIILCLVLWIFMPYFLKNLGVLEFQKDNFTGYNQINHHHEDQEEGALAYFESDFEQQPYRLPYDSSVRMLSLSLIFILITFVIREFFLKKYG